MTVAEAASKSYSDAMDTKKMTSLASQSDRTADRELNRSEKRGKRRDDDDDDWSNQQRQSQDMNTRSSLLKKMSPLKKILSNLPFIDKQFFGGKIL